MAGHIAICLDVAETQSIVRGYGIRDEMRILLVHGECRQMRCGTLILIRGSEIPYGAPKAAATTIAPATSPAHVRELA